MFGNHGKLGIEVNWWTQIICSTAAVIPLPWTGFRVKVVFCSDISSEGVDKEYIALLCWCWSVAKLAKRLYKEKYMKGFVWKYITVYIKYIKILNQIYKWNFESKSNNYFNLNLVWNIGLAAYSPPETFNSPLRPLDEWFWDPLSRLILNGGGGVCRTVLPSSSTLFNLEFWK